MLLYTPKKHHKVDNNKGVRWILLGYGMLQINMIQKVTRFKYIYQTIAMEVCGDVPQVRGYGVQSIWYRCILTGGRGNTVQVSGNTPGPIRQQLAVNLLKYKEGAEGLGTDGKGATAGGVRYPFVGNYILGGGASGYVVWIGILGHVGGY